MLKATCLVGAVAIVVGLGLVIDVDSRPKNHQSCPSPTIESTKVHAPGRVEGATEEIDLRPQLFGRVEGVLVREGETVEAGTALIRLDGAQQEYECAAAEADVAAAKAELERLTNGARDEERREASANVSALSAQLAGVRQRHERLTSLRKTGAAAAQEVDDLDTEINRLTAQRDAARARHELLEAPARDDEVRRTRAKVAAAEAQLKLAQHECDKTTLRALHSVQILRINVHTGELNDPDSPEPAMIVADTSRLYVRAYVDEFDAPRVQQGMRARVTADGLGDREVRGHVVRLAPRMTQKPLRTDDPIERFDTKVREVWVELEDDDEREGLVIGLPVDVVLEVEPNASGPREPIVDGKGGSNAQGGTGHE
ncbi:MAG TPA: HlyD family efflux transporter periplasmic adaptor subunit [Polyangiaceae bacterium]|jgi:multidrug resistance efflux pump|nr:HlyD family efflux transporter periplasmic adaptor subunit [Polyangiaceae bacterium]